MGTALTRVYRKGALEAEGFPVADVSDYLEQTNLSPRDYRQNLIVKKVSSRAPLAAACLGLDYTFRRRDWL